MIYNIAVFIGVFLFLAIKQFIFNDTIQWLGNIGTSIFAMLLYVYIQRFEKKEDEKKKGE